MVGLLFTCAYGHVHSAKLLFELGAYLNLQGFFEETALQLAVAFEYPDVVQFLVDSGADLYLRDTWNMTALDWALDIEDKEMIQILRLAEEFQV